MVQIPVINEFGCFLRSVKKLADSYLQEERQRDSSTKLEPRPSYDMDLMDKACRLTYLIKPAVGGVCVARNKPIYVFPIEYVFLVNMLLVSAYSDGAERGGEKDGGGSGERNSKKVMYIHQKEAASKETMWEENPMPCLKKRRTLRQH